MLFGMAAGMAKKGYKPVVSIYSSFYQRAFDQVIHDICIQNLPVIGIKTNDLRDILLRAYNMGMENSSAQDANIHMEVMNQLLF